MPRIHKSQTLMAQRLHRTTMDVIATSQICGSFRLRATPTKMCCDTSTTPITRQVTPETTLTAHPPPPSTFSIEYRPKHRYARTSLLYPNLSAFKSTATTRKIPTHSTDRTPHPFYMTLFVPLPPSFTTQLSSSSTTQNSIIDNRYQTPSEQQHPTAHARRAL